ncbi:MAG: DUF4190 domain-containing protein [Planctomycetota bacterium]
MPDPQDPYGDPNHDDAPSGDGHAEEGYALSEPVDTPLPPNDPFTPPPTSPPAPQDTVLCQSCGANLSGATLGGHCPTCGAPIVASGYPTSQSNGMALTSMILGIIGVVAAPGGFCCVCSAGVGLVCGILGLIFYFPAVSAIEAGNAPEKSRGMAKTGLICGIIAIGLSLLYAVVITIMVITSP